jgi:DNA-binding transcriptional LysR family regulator
MDIETLKTFVEVTQTRHFAKAADNLFVTQAAVSARIAQLENKVGARLFTRARNNIQLTAAGHRLFPHAETILGAWNRALVEVSGPDDAQLLTIGCLPSIGEMFLDQILEYFRGAEGILIQVEQLNSVAIIPRVREQSLSLALMYEPPRARDLESKHVADLELVMVSSERHASVEDVADYIYVDWGTSFAVSHELELPVTPAPVMRVDTPQPALRSVASSGGTAYLPRRLVLDDLSAGHLHLVPDAPVLIRSVFLTRSLLGGEQEEVAAALNDLIKLLSTSR